MKDSSSDAVQIVYYSSCLGKDMIQTNKCDGLKVSKSKVRLDNIYNMCVHYIISLFLFTQSS